jgi:hypothetical protein
MPKSLITLTLVVLTCQVFAQGPDYPMWTQRADSLYKLNDYKNAALAYSNAFKSFGWKGFMPDRYNAARMWAMASVKDSAFSNLERIVARANYSYYDYIVADEGFKSLYKDVRWNPLIARIRKNKEDKERLFDKNLSKLLDSLRVEDQRARNQLTELRNNVNASKSVSDSIGRIMLMTDSLNYFLTKNIFKKYGYPNYDVVGPEGSSNFWLLIQHQDKHPEFQEEVLAVMKVEVDKGKASATDYAYLVDRVKVNTEQLQVYGTQMQVNAEGTSYEPKPVIEPEKLNSRRNSVGLDTIEEYIHSMNSRYYGTLRKE